MKTAIYIRVSHKDRNPENQLPALQAMAAAREFEVVEVISEVMSGAKKDRPGLRKLLDGAHKGRYSCVMVWAIDRLGRSMQGVLETVMQLDQSKCALLSYSESWIDMQGPMRALLIAIFAWMAEQEREKIRERVLAGNARRRKEGKPVGGANKIVHVDLDAAMRCRKEGLSYRAAAKRLGISTTVLHRALAQEPGR